MIRDQETKFPWVQKENLIHIGDLNTANNYRNQDRTFATEHIFSLNITDLEDCMDGYIQGGLEDFSTVDTRLGALGEDRSGVYEENTADVRYQYWFEPYMDYFLIAKFYQNTITARYFQERVPLIRLSEMYYIAAECATTTSDGVDYLEKVRSNRGLASFPLNRSMSREELLKEIRKEYQKEFWGEGQLWFYYKRNSITDFSEYMTNIDFFTFKIPDTEESTAGRE
ncbi:MAG TPA: RagB/SusD family nutrient uptake outer membrane protein [Candidatus Butyricimonas faecavium]|nr:RagB/SusD family nutrient uptake outer membrane protein [Candidatus Butyricimonas faecavium]